MLAQMRELVETCDADGFYFNLMRCFYSFHPDRAAKCAALMTTWMGEIRRMLDEVGERKGQGPLPLAVQVLSRVQDCTYFGHDVRAWTIPLSTASTRWSYPTSWSTTAARLTPGAIPWTVPGPSPPTGPSAMRCRCGVCPSATG